MTWLFCQVGRGRVVDIVTRWTVEGSNPGVGENLRTRPDRHWGLPNLLYNGHWVSFLKVKKPGIDVHHPTPSSAKVKEREELTYTSTFPSGFSRPVKKVHFTLEEVVMVQKRSSCIATLFL